MTGMSAPTDQRRRSRSRDRARPVISAIRLIHPFPVAVVVATTGVLLELAHHGGLPVSALLRGCGAVLCSQVAVGAYNDYADRFSDALVQPRKPIPSGLASPATARRLVVLGLVGMVPLALSFGVASLVLVLAGTAAGLAYDRWWKRTPVSVAGYVLGFLILVTWIWAIAGRLTIGFLILYPAGALLVTAAHLAQSLPDVETDREVGAHGLAVALGVELSARLILACYAALAVGAAVLSTIAGAAWLAVLPAAGLAMVIGAAVRLDRDAYSYRSRVATFRVVAPALGMLAVTAVIATTRLGIL